jgi:hypothetical protein
MRLLNFNVVMIKCYIHRLYYFNYLVVLCYGYIFRFIA